MGSQRWGVREGTDCTSQNGWNMRVRRRLCSRAAIGLAAAVGVGSMAMADTATWLNPVSGNWNDATKWSTNPNYPNNGTPAGVNYDANVAASGAAYSIGLSSNVT